MGFRKSPEADALRALLAERDALVEAADKLHTIAKIIDDNIHDNGTDKHRLLLDSEYHTGVVVDWAYAILTMIRDFAQDDAAHTQDPDTP